jgi:hypothetical protein
MYHEVLALSTLPMLDGSGASAQHNNNESIHIIPYNMDDVVGVMSTSTSTLASGYKKVYYGCHRIGQLKGTALAC